MSISSPHCNSSFLSSNKKMQRTAPSNLIEDIRHVTHPSFPWVSAAEQGSSLHKFGPRTQHTKICCASQNLRSELPRKKHFWKRKERVLIWWSGKWSGIWRLWLYNEWLGWRMRLVKEEWLRLGTSHHFGRIRFFPSYNMTPRCASWDSTSITIQKAQACRHVAIHCYQLAEIRPGSNTNLSPASRCSFPFHWMYPWYHI